MSNIRQIESATGMNRLEARRFLKQLPSGSDPILDFGVRMNWADLFGPLAQKFAKVGTVSALIGIVLACAPKPTEQPAKSSSNLTETPVAGPKPKDTAVMTLTVPSTAIPKPTETSAPKNADPLYEDVESGKYKELSESVDEKGIKTVRAFDAEKGVLLRFRQSIPGDDSSIAYLNSLDCVSGRNKGCIGYEIVSRENYSSPNKTYKPVTKVGSLEVDPAAGKAKVAKEVRDDNSLVDIEVQDGYLIRPDATALADINGEVKLVDSKGYDIKFWIGGKAPETITQKNPGEYSVTIENTELAAPKISGLRQEMSPDGKIIRYVADKGNAYGLKEGAVAGSFQPIYKITRTPEDAQVVPAVSLRPEVAKVLQAAQPGKLPIPFDTNGGKIFIQSSKVIARGFDELFLSLPIGTIIVNPGLEGHNPRTVNITYQTDWALIDIGFPQLVNGLFFRMFVPGKDIPPAKLSVDYGSTIATINDVFGPTYVAINGSYYDPPFPKGTNAILFFGSATTDNWRGFTYPDMLTVNGVPVMLKSKENSPPN